MNHQIEGIHYGNLIKARAQFESFRQGMQTDRDKAGAVQAFEFHHHFSLLQIHKFFYALLKNNPSSNNKHIGMANNVCEKTSGGVSSMPITKQAMIT